MKTIEREKSISKEEEKYFVASQWKLMWWKFKKHKLAIIGGTVLIIFYTGGIFCEFFSPYDPHRRNLRYIFLPPQKIHFFDEEGKFYFRPFVYKIERKIDPESFRKIFKEDKTKKYPIYFFVHGDKYKFWNLWETDIHFFGVKKPGVIFLLGCDRMGRDMLSRIIYAARISLSVGLIGVSLSFIIGLALGGISGYLGGWVDTVIQRIIETIRCFPTIPLWMALSAALPPTWSPLKIYFGITVVLSFIGWTGLARVIRGQILSLREQDFTMAAYLSGSTDKQIITRHLLPSCLSYILVSLSLSIPGMILGETSLSFLGLGLRAPIISWGVLLQEAQNVTTVALHPWLLLPVVFVIVAVLAFNFLGDGLRDAADPYK